LKKPVSPGSKRRLADQERHRDRPRRTRAERDDYGQVVLAQRLRDALARLNRALPAEALDDAFRKLTRPKVRSSSCATVLCTSC